MKRKCFFLEIYSRFIIDCFGCNGKHGVKHMKDFEAQYEWKQWVQFTT